MKKLLFALLVVLPMAGCSCDNEEIDQAAVEKSFNLPVTAEEPKAVDPSVASCGEFPRSTDDGTVQSRYSVCKNADTGDCYIKTHYPRPIQGCDPEFGKYRTGKPACFTYISDIHEMGGDKIEQSLPEYRPGDACELTTPDYFAAVMKAR